MKKFIGLDLGTSIFKAVAFTPKGDKFMLTHAYVLPYPANSILDGTILDFGEVSQQISKIIESGNFNKAPIAVAIKGAMVAAKSVKVPYISKEQLKNDMLFIAEQYMRADPEEYAIDYKLVKTDTENSIAQIAFAAIRKENLADYISIIESAQQEVGAIDVESLALSDLYTRMKLPKNGISMILHIGHTVTQAIFIKDGNYSHSESCYMAGEHCTNLLTAALQLNSEEVESAKTSPELHPQGDAAKKVIEERFIPDFIKNIDKVVNNHTLAGGLPIDRIYLSGGSATLHGLNSALEAKFEVPIILMNPTALIDVTNNIAKQVLELKPAALNVAIAMALR
ncbi:MAG: type IV pilus assembly protein PilM [Deferribacteraceae bacterium]|jgi:type IV pilus assembly protein PilM|nr:type IV pilus assembly protein PilM [Deferribacteraceae bacterium]